MATVTRSLSGRDAVPEDARYECLLKIASGGMATVYVGRLRGKYGFSRLVAIKRAHAHLLDDEEFRNNLIREARLASRIHHPNVVSVLDVDEPSEELMLVMDYVEGTSLAQLLGNAVKAKTLLAPGVAVRIGLDVAAGLHAAHELCDDTGAPLRIVHRDVSPQNILIGVDGLSRIADFGIAKWTHSNTSSAAGLKGKFAYMAPEYVAQRPIDRRADIFALGTVLWEALVGQRLFRGDGELETIRQVVELTAPPPSSIRKDLPPELDAPILKALAKDPAQRFERCDDLARAIEDAARAAKLETGAAAVATTLRDLYGDVLDARRVVLRDTLEARSDVRSGQRLSHSELPTVEFGLTTATVEPSLSSEAPTLALLKSAEAGPTAPEPAAATPLPVAQAVEPARVDAPLEVDAALPRSTPMPSVLPARAPSRGRLALAALGVVGAVSLGVGWLALREAPRPPSGGPEGAPARALSAAPSPTASPSPPPRKTEPGAAEPGTAEVHASHGAEPSASSMARASAHVPARTIPPPRTSPSASDPPPPPPSTGKPVRPGLGY